MDNKILTDEGWERRIRDKLGVDAEYLPDSVLQQPDCINVAEAKIINRIPDYILIPSENRVMLEYAVVLQCCVLLCDGMPSRLPKKQSGPHESYELETEWSKRKAPLKDELDETIQGIIDDNFPEFSGIFRPVFTVTYPKREWER